MTLKLTGSKAGLVLQGYFRGEQFRGAGKPTTPVQPIHSGRAQLSPQPALLPPQMRSWAVQAKPGLGLRGMLWPELLPSKMRGMIGQTKPQQRGSPWSGAPRPELLPGMAMPRSVMTAQAQTRDGITIAPVPSGQLRLIGEGRALDPGTRRTMEAFFQTDFSGVRIHEGPAAPALGALAFTLGEAVYFAPGQYRPGTRKGLELLGHELTHVVQQRAGRVANPYAQGIAIVQDPVLEAEADAMGRAVADPGGSSHAPSLTRWLPPDGARSGPLEWIQRKALLGLPVARPKPRAHVLQQMEDRGYSHGEKTKSSGYYEGDKSPKLVVDEVTDERRGLQVPEMKTGHLFRKVKNKEDRERLYWLEAKSGKVDTKLTDIMERVRYASIVDDRGLKDWHLALVNTGKGPDMLAWSGGLRIEQAEMEDIANDIDVALWSKYRLSKDALPGRKTCALPRALAAVVDENGHPDDWRSWWLSEQHFSKTDKWYFINHSDSCDECRAGIPGYILRRQLPGSYSSPSRDRDERRRSGYSRHERSQDPPRPTGKRKWEAHVPERPLQQRNLDTSSSEAHHEQRGNRKQSSPKDKRQRTSQHGDSTSRRNPESPTGKRK